MRLPPEATDFVAITPSTGPTRLQKDSPRASPYNTPSPSVERHSSSLSLSSSSSILSVSSISSELEYDPDRRTRHTHRRATVYNNNHHISKYPKSANESDSDITECGQIPVSTAVQPCGSSADNPTQKTDRGTGRTAQTAQKHGPPPMVFEDDSDDDFLIPKPPGEVGRPNRGGYSLYPVLGWPKKKYDKVKDFINNLVEEHLNCELPMSAQRRGDIKKVQTEAAAKFVFLKEYRGLWVTDDFIRNHLKYQKSVIKKEKLEKMVADARPSVPTSTAISDSAATAGHKRSGHNSGRK
ncbi:hypothetical protein DFJ43DRAFT_1088012 [Lentinula guzmanii]|uniref:Uncharacterized protein n=1 Tax=Lentinula guzmanii TaxID=2804957 RepID=A0AA38MXI4_9AGAR|nr:hypothetical protein DFJ43DRAFT_1088012 [Lentinula guzmanii]